MFSDHLISRLKKAYQVCLLTGYDLSVESKAPLILTQTTKWNNFNIERLARQVSLKNQSGEFWDLCHSVRKAFSEIKPNLGHYSLVDLEQMFKKFYLITLNDDNLHRSAGSQRVAELYGNFYRSKCTSCEYNRYETVEGYNQNGLVKCPECGNLLRPDIVLRDESISQRTLDAINQAAATSEVFISIGVSQAPKEVENLAYVAKGNGAYILEINSKKTNLTSHTNEYVEGESGKILPHLVTALTDS